MNVQRVTTARERKGFIRLPWRLHAGQPGWVPPLIAEQRVALDPRRGAFFRHGGSGALWMVSQGGEPVGRIAAFRNEVHLSTHRDGAGFFGFFDCVDDPAVASALLHEAEAWLRASGLTRVRGPANFDIQEEAGVSLDAHDLQPMVGMTWTPAYYRRLLEAAGYAPCRDLHVYRAELSSEDKIGLARLERLAERLRRESRVVIRPLNLNRLEEESKFMAVVFADAWRDNWGHVPISELEFLTLYRRYRAFLVPEMVLLAEVSGEPAGAWVAMPDLNDAIKRIDGRLWPWGWWKLLRARRHITRGRVMMMGVRPKFRRLGLPLLMAVQGRAAWAQRGGQMMESSWLLDENHEVIAIVERMSGRRVQTLRLYEKGLDG